jgi:hypothetical protein
MVSILGSYIWVTLRVIMGIHCYIAVMVGNFIGLGIFMIRIYNDAGTGNAVTLRQFVHELKEWRQWLPVISNQLPLIILIYL